MIDTDKSHLPKKILQESIQEEVLGIEDLKQGSSKCQPEASTKSLCIHSESPLSSGHWTSARIMWPVKR